MQTMIGQNEFIIMIIILLFSSVKKHGPYTMHVLLRYNACSLCHKYEHTQFTIHFIKEVKSYNNNNKVLSFVSRCGHL